MTIPAGRTCSLCCLLSLILTTTAPATAAQVKKGKNAEDAKWKQYELEPEKPHDLLSLVRLPDHALRGTWKKLDGSFVCEPSVDALLMLPVVVSGSYSIDCEFTRRAGQDTVAIVLPVGESSTSIVLSGWAGAASGIDIVSGREARDGRVAPGAAVRPGRLLNGQRYKLRIDITAIRGRAIIQAWLNEQRFVMWKGLASQVSYWPDFSIPCTQSLALLSNSCVTDFHKCELTVSDGGQAYQLEGPGKTDWLTPLTRVEDEPPRQILAQCATWNGRKYYMTDKPVDIVTARRLAAELHGRLLTISSKEENDFFLKESRGVKVWTSGWRRSEDRVWRDERNRPLKYFGKWGARQPELSYLECVLGIWTASDWLGWHDFSVADKLHACIEWGEEYPEVKGQAADGQAAKEPGGVSQQGVEQVGAVARLRDARLAGRARSSRTRPGAR